MINLNSDNFKEREYAAIFNGGAAGRVEDVTIEVTKKSPVDPDNQPDYKVFVVDQNGAKVNEGFYYADENDSKKGDLLVSRIVHIARAVLGKDYEFPTYTSYKEAADGLFKLIAKNAGEQTFSVFVTYGNVGYPSKYLKLRYFDFIEPSSVDANATRLFTKKTDLMERITADAPLPTEGILSGGSNESSDDDWV